MAFGLSSAALAKKIRESISVDFYPHKDGAQMVVKWGRHEIIRKVIPREVFE